MARLPSGDYLIQQIGENVILFEDHTERQIAKFNPNAGPEISAALRTIDGSELGPEDKAWAAFWAGYFYAHAVHAGGDDQ